MASPSSHLAPLKEIENDTLELNFECPGAVTDAYQPTSTDTMSTETTSSEAAASDNNRDTEEELEPSPTRRHQSGVWGRRFTTALVTPLERRASQMLTAAILLPRRASLVPYAQHTGDLLQSAMNARARLYSYGGAMTYPTGHEPVEPKQSREQFDNASRVSPTWVAGWNVLNIIQGVGILGVPYACAHAGWISVPVILLVALICCFTGRLIGECLYEYPPEHCKKWVSDTEAQ
ncbi:unnamed protein product [Calicophoron daubneyi]|uniref:Amino acid transporter transmembrane domain-containing protein n=1 Tax=Calicophoron daubneyi TaxID=300641 RepID=A0AAV2TI01_CALDB